MTMNTTSDHLDDEILSALLDGEPAAGPDAAAHLAACDRCSGRQAELGAARAAVAAAPVEPLDELTRRRLVAGALRADEGTAGGAGKATASPRARSPWAQRHSALIGSAAAVLLAVLVGVPFVVGHGGGSPAERTLSAAPDAARQESASPFLGDLGDLTDRDHLRLRLSGASNSAVQSDRAGSVPGEPGPSPAAGASTAGPVPAAAPSSGGLAKSPGFAEAATPSTTPGSRNGGGVGETGQAKPTQGAAPSGADTFASDQAASRDRADADTCVAALLAGPARGGRLIGSGTGTWRGSPAIVAAFELSGGTVAFVTDRAGCAVRDRFPI
jgi:hypothetical protein